MEKPSDKVVRLHNQGCSIEQIRYECGFKDKHSVYKILRTRLGISFKAEKKQASEKQEDDIYRAYVAFNMSLKELSKSFGFCESAISDILTRKMQRAKGKHVDKFVSSLEPITPLSCDENEYGSIDWNNRYRYEDVKKEGHGFKTDLSIQLIYSTIYF